MLTEQLPVGVPAALASFTLWPVWYACGTPKLLKGSLQEMSSLKPNSVEKLCNVNPYNVAAPALQVLNFYFCLGFKIKRNVT